MASSSGSQWLERVNQGPTDPALLFRQDDHRTKFIYNDNRLLDRKLLCRRSESSIWEWIEDASAGTKAYIEAYGFRPVSRIGNILYDHGLITALVERWRPETHTFHLPIGETGITLQDVEVLLGLRVDGDPVTGIAALNMRGEEACEMYLGFRPDPKDCEYGRLKLTTLLDHIRTFPVRDGAPGVMEERRARCFILYLLGGLLLPDSTRGKVPIYLLQFLNDAATSSRYSWGGAVLSCLYRNLCAASLNASTSIYGCVLLVQVWAWERIKTCRPTILRGYGIPPIGFPLAARWRGPKDLSEITGHALRAYRDQLAVLQEGDFIWMPYDGFLHELTPECRMGQNIWRARTWLIYFEVVEGHLVDRVMRQFGFGQHIPIDPPIMDAQTHKDMHAITKSGRPYEDWAMRWSNPVHNWNTRYDTVQDGIGRYDDDQMFERYMSWYHRMTLMSVTNPPSRRSTQSAGFQGSAETVSAQAQMFQQIARFCEQQREIYFEPGDASFNILSTVIAMAQKGVSLGTTQRFYGDSSQTFVDYDPNQSQMLQTYQRPQHAHAPPPPGGGRRQRQHPHRIVELEHHEEEHHDEEHHDDDDDDEEEHRDDDDEEEEEHRDDDDEEEEHHEEEDEVQSSNMEDVQSNVMETPPLALRRPRREPHPRRLPGEGSSTANKVLNWLKGKTKK